MHLDALCSVFLISSGIGRAISLRLAQDGATVIVNFSRSQGPADEVVSTINSTHGTGRAIAMKADAGSVVETKKMVEDIVVKHQKIDIVVCNAAKLYGLAGLENTTEEQFDEAFRVNVKGIYFLVQVCSFIRFRRHTLF